MSSSAESFRSLNRDGTFSVVPREILWGKRFVDILGRENGRTNINMDRFHEVVDA